MIGTVQETPIVVHKIMVPYGMKGTVKSITEGDYTVEQTVAVLETPDGEKELTLIQKWPVRTGRPYKEKLPPDKPLVTGQESDRRHVSHCEGRRGCGTGSLRVRQNSDPAPAGQVGRG